jgi:hypothetical protein
LPQEMNKQSSRRIILSGLQESDPIFELIFSSLWILLHYTETECSIIFQKKTFSK